MKVFKGLTLVEVMIVIGIIAILLSFVGFNFIRTRTVISLDTTVSSIINDIKSQQTGAMSKLTPHGIRFETDRYILFFTSEFNPDDSSNFPINLENNNRFTSINLPQDQIIFSSSSGEIESYDLNNNNLTISNNNEQKIIHLNKLGTIYEIN